MPFSFKDNKGKLTGVVGAACCAILLTVVPKFEGVKTVGYKDPIGIVTACVGSTKNAVFGRKYTEKECEQRLIDELSEHAEGVKKCVKVPLTTGQLAASVSLAFNIGVSTFCNSTMARLFNSKEYAKACAQFDRWVYADGRKLPGLVERRKVERKICEGTA